MLLQILEPSFYSSWNHTSTAAGILFYTPQFESCLYSRWNIACTTAGIVLMPSTCSCWNIAAQGVTHLLTHAYTQTHTLVHIPHIHTVHIHKQYTYTHASSHTTHTQRHTFFSAFFFSSSFCWVKSRLCFSTTALE